MNALLKSLIMFLYPAQCRCCKENLDPSDGYYICKSCWAQTKFIRRPYCETCGNPLRSAANLPERVPSCVECPKNIRFRKARAVAYYGSTVGEAIQLLKYQGKRVMANSLANLMLSAMPAFFEIWDYDCIIPVPIHRKKRRKRGYNQMELIGHILSGKTGIPIDTQNLIKAKDTKDQVGLSDEDRLKNIRGAFDVPNPSRTSGKRVLLIDDVFTTGATANECARTLMEKGKAEYVDVFTIAKRVREQLTRAPS